MATIEEIRDIAFYIIRKLNDFIINFTTTPQQPRPRTQYRQMTEEEIRRDEEIHENIMRQIEEIQTSLNTPIIPSRIEEEEIVDERHEHIMRQIQKIERSLYTPPPSPIIPTRTEEECEIIDAGVSELLRKVNEKPIPPSFPFSSHQEMIKKFIKQDEERIMDLQKQAHEKRIILNYLLDELIQRRERKEDANVIKLLEEEFERLRLERERLEKRIIELKEHIRFMQN